MTRLACLTLLIGAAVWSQEQPMTSLNYARPFESPTRSAFIALPPGAVTPQGWLRDWCLAARDGYTGHMDEVDQAFRQAWADDYQMTGDKLAWPRGAWPYEGGGYWFDGLARLGYILHDEALTAQAKRRLGGLAQHMRPDGILFLWWLDRHNAEHRQWTSVDDHWPCWASGLVGRAMAGYYHGSGDAEALRALEMAYSGGYDALRLGWGMSNPWPAFDAYTWTGNKQIAAGLDALFAPDGAKDSSWARYRHLPNLAPGAEANDHVVHFLESTTPWALGYLWTGRREFLDTALAWHDLLAERAMQPHGVPVSDEYWGPTGAFRGSETCDVAGYLWSQIALLTVSGQGRLADRVERAFFNAGPATVARDIKTHVYFQSPNRIAPGSPDYPHGPRASGGSYAATHQPLCCTAALNRIVPNYVQHMWLATHDNGLAAATYGPCRLTALAGDKVRVTIDCQTNYPFEETITLRLEPEREVRFPLSLRIPGWCAAPELAVNGQATAAAPDANGFVRLDRGWKPGDVVALRLPMAARVTTGRDVNAGTATATGGTVTLAGEGAPFATVSYGPLLFALPTEGQDANTADPAASWRVALSAGERGLTVKRGAMPARWDWPLAAPLTIEAAAVPVDWPLDLANPKMPATTLAAAGPRRTITLVPYGCARLRLSMFPVAESPYAFQRTISRDVLERYLARSITMEGLLNGAGDLTDNIRMLRETGAKLIGRSLCLWGGEANLLANLARAKEQAALVHAADPEMVLQACIFEIVTTDVAKVPVPAWAFEALGLPVEERAFRYEAMLYPDGKFRDHWRQGHSVPDVSQIETKLWFTFLGRSFIDAGCEAIHLGQTELMNHNDRRLDNYAQVLGLLRAYAVDHARRGMVLLDSHVPSGGLVRDGELLMDFHSFPLRIKEVAGKPIEGILEVGHYDSLYGRSKGGRTYSGWTCEHLPYLAEIDNWGRSAKPGQPGLGGAWIWGYDEISWFAHLAPEQRAAWLRYAWDWIRSNDPNGYLQMPGSRTLAAPADARRWYHANRPSAATPGGFGDEVAIAGIWSS